MKEVIIIGNKPLNNFPMGKIIDSFENNVRCNFIIPGRNNDGHTFDKLAMCSHEYHYFKENDADLEEILNVYTPRYNEENIRETLPAFKENISKYSEIFHATDNTSESSSFLRSVKCPHSIMGLPRTGFRVIMDNIIKGYSVFLVNFSLPHTEHPEFGFVEDKNMNTEASKSEVEDERSRVRKFEEGGVWHPSVHHTKNEVQIIKWLHEEEIIDASLCLIADTPELSYNLGGLKFSNYMKQRVELYTTDP